MATAPDGIERRNGDWPEGKAGKRSNGQMFAAALPKARRTGAERRRTWAVILLGLAVAAECMVAMGAGSKAMAELFLALTAMSCISMLIAWLYLRKRNPPEV